MQIQNFEKKIHSSQWIIRSVLYSMMLFTSVHNIYIIIYTYLEFKMNYLICTLHYWDVYSLVHNVFIKIYTPTQFTMNYSICPRNYDAVKFFPTFLIVQCYCLIVHISSGLLRQNWRRSIIFLILGSNSPLVTLNSI